MNTLVHILAKSGLLTKDLDYHLIRASMVLIFLAFGAPEMVRLRGAGPDSVYQQWPADFLALSRLRHPRGQLVSRRFRMALRRPPLPGILEQATGTWELSGRLPRLSGRLPSFRSCRMAGTRLPDFPRWPATFRS